MECPWDEIIHDVCTNMDAATMSTLMQACTVTHRLLTDPNTLGFILNVLQPRSTLRRPLLLPSHLWHRTTQQLEQRDTLFAFELNSTSLQPC